MGEYIVNKIRKEIERQKPKSGSMTVGLGKYWFSGPDIEALLSRYEQKSEQLTTLQAEKERLEGKVKDSKYLGYIRQDLINMTESERAKVYKFVRRLIAGIEHPTQEPTNGS